MATSPGRSAIQTTPRASTATSARNRRTRIIGAPFSRCRLERCDGVGGETPTGVERPVARLGLAYPSLDWLAGVSRELRQFRQRARDVALGGALLDTGQDCSAIVAARLLAHRADAHELLGVGLQAVEKAAFTHRLARGAQHR